MTVAVVPFSLSQRRRLTNPYSRSTHLVTPKSPISFFLLILRPFPPILSVRSPYILFFSTESILLPFFVLSFFLCLFFADAAIKRWRVENGALD